MNGNPGEAPVYGVTRNAGSAGLALSRHVWAEPCVEPLPER